MQRYKCNDGEGFQPMEKGFTTVEKGLGDMNTTMEKGLGDASMRAELKSDSKLTK